MVWRVFVRIVELIIALYGLCLWLCGAFNWPMHASAVTPNTVLVWLGYVVGISVLEGWRVDRIMRDYYREF